jgi:parallel beta-helix repeat protein
VKPARARSLRALTVQASAWLLVALVFMIPGGALAATGPTLYVATGNPACSNSGPGTAAQPFCTISAAASKAVAGNVVQVAAGTYNERVSPASSGTSGAPIVYTAAPGATVTVGSGQSDGFLISGKSWITITGFNVTGTSSYGIDVSSAAGNVTISNDHVSYSGQPVSGQTKFGIRINGATDVTISGNTVDHNTDSGIAVVGSSARVQVLNNNCWANARGYQRAAAGIRIYQSTDNTVAGNLSHNNEDSGIESYPGAKNTLIYDNVTYNNGDHGIDNLTTTNQRIIANSVYKNVTAGINVEGSSTGAVVENNISVDNGINSPRTHSDIRIENGSTTGAVVDNNVVWLNANDTLYIWNSTSYSTLAAFRAASGQGAHDIWADPKWVDMAGGNFHLTAGSPAIDSADSGVSGQPAADVEGTLRVDDPSTANSGLGPRAYDDRGAYEYAPSGADLPPAARLTVTPTSGVTPLAVSADASASTDTDATPIAGYTFNFGDGTVVGPQFKATTTHSYTTAGTYTVTVTVRDTAGLSSTASATVTVTDLPPAARLSVSPASGAPPLAVLGDASGSTDSDATPIASYSFDFGDGTVTGAQAQATASHTYTTPGRYTVTVAVTDTANKSSTATAQVTVGSVDAPPVARLTVAPSPASPGAPVSADASASTDTDATPIASYRFDFGDGTVAGPQSAPTAAHTYLAPGTFTVTATVADTAGNSSTATAQVVVQQNVQQNAVRNSGFETDLSGWNTSGSGSGITLTRVSGGHSGTQAALLSNTSGAASTCVLNDSPNWVATTAATTYTGTLWARADTAGQTLKLRFREYNTGGTLISTATTLFTLTTTWSQVSVSVTTAAGDTLDFNAYISSAAPGTCFYADDAAITNG